MSSWAHRRILPILRHARFFRVFHLADPREGEVRVWRVFWRPNFGYVIPLNHPANLQGAFFWPQSPTRLNLWRVPTTVLEQHFKRDWQDSQSDVRHALTWCDQTQDERHWRSIRWKCGGREELEAVLSASYRCESDWPQNETVVVISHFSQPHVGSWFRFSNGMARWVLEEDHRLVRMSQRLAERNQATVDLPNGARNDWNEPWNYGAEPAANVEANIRIEIEPPTQHERLEAALFLRDWLTQNAPDLLSDWCPT